MDKNLMWQYKLTLMENNTLVSIEVIDGRNLSSRLVTQETKPLDVTNGSHTNKVVFNVISSPRNHVIIGLFLLILHNPWVHWYMKCHNPTFGRMWGWHSHSWNGDLGVHWDSQNFRVGLRGSKHLTLGCSLYHWKTMKV